jgi:xanthosine utilization system XapX-like protein
LNEAALANRRAAYQASQAPPPAGPVVAASGKMQLTGPQFIEFQRLLKQGKSLPEAYAGAKAQNLADTLGSVSDAEMQADMARRRARSKS